MKRFSERDPVRVGAVGLVSLLLVGLAVLFADRLPFLSGGESYTALFADAAGLRTDDDVRIAGIRVGSVESIGLAGDAVRVRFTVDGAWVGDQTTVAIKIKSLLGRDYLELDPRGPHTQNPHRNIPLTRTVTPISVGAALTGLTQTVGSIDTKQLARSFDVLTKTFAHTPHAVRSALTGLARLSRSIAARDDALRRLSDNTAGLASQLSDSNRAFTTLIQKGALLLEELQARSAAIGQLLDDTRRFADEVSGFVHDNESTLAPALAQLTQVSHVLAANRGHIDEAVRLIGPYYSLLADATGSGRWLDTYLCGLFTSANAPQLSSTALRDCHPRSSG